MASVLNLAPEIKKRKRIDAREVVIKLKRCDGAWTKTSSKCLLNLPANALKHIFTFFTFHEIAQLREVCQSFNAICKAVLNRESERICEEARIHIINMGSHIKHSGNFKSNPPNFADYRLIIEAIRDNLNIALYRYKLYMKNNKACFIPGKVLDLIRKQLVIAKSKSPNMKKFEKLNKQTKFCIVAAISHFFKVVVPLIKAQEVKSRLANLTVKGPEAYPSVGSSAMSQTERVVPNMPVVKSKVEDSRDKKEKKLKVNYEAFKEQKRLVKKQAKKIRVHEKLIEYQAKKIKDLHKSLLELKTNLNMQKLEFNHRIECLEKDAKSKIELVLVE